MSSILATIGTYLPSVIKFAPSLWYLSDAVKDPDAPELPALPYTYKGDISTCCDDSKLFVKSKITGYGKHKIIYYNSILKELDQNLFSILCEREYLYIKANGNFKASIFASFVSAVAAFSIPFFQSYLPSLGAPLPYVLPLLGGPMIYGFTRAVFEIKADRLAITHASDAELLVFEKFLAIQQDVKNELDYLFPAEISKEGRKVIFQAKGQPRRPTDFRLVDVREELSKRNISERTPDSESDIKLKNYLRTTWTDMITNASYEIVALPIAVNL